MKIASAQEMFDLGKSIGAQLRAGDLILLNGPLGAGKTLLVQGIGAALGFTEVTSPTFVISRTHKGALSLIHVDTYRLLESGKAALYLDDLDLDTARESAVTVIEWGGEDAARLSDERLEIEINRSADSGSDDLRTVNWRGIGSRWEDFKL
jgi:tRNA threonylcarbamoyladenosine biosynthesis protein TsaE